MPDRPLRHMRDLNTISNAGCHAQFYLLRLYAISRESTDRIAMDVYRPSTRDSQRTFVPALQPVEFPKDLRLSHTLSSTNSQAPTPYYSDEKSVVESPILGHAALPGLRLNSPLPTSPRRGSHWTERDLDPLPRYPGTPVDVPGTLEVPPIEQQSRFEGTICGVRRGLFILLLGGGAIVLLAIAIGVGVGVGLSHQKQIGAERAGYVL